MTAPPTAPVTSMIVSGGLLDGNDALMPFLGQPLPRSIRSQPFGIARHFAKLVSDSSDEEFNT